MDQRENSGSKGSKRKCPLIGILAVKNLLITKAELEKGLIQLAGSTNLDADLEAYFRKNELVSGQNIQRLSRAANALKTRRKEITFGAMAVRMGFINQSVVDLALEEQQAAIRNRQSSQRIGDMLVASGFMTIRQRDYILKLQKRKQREHSDAENSQLEVLSGKTGEPSTLDSGKPGPESMAGPKIISGGIKLEVAGDRMAAFLSKTDDFDGRVNVEEIKASLFDEGIVSGLAKDTMIQGFINSSGFRSQSFRVARGTQPIEGRDAKIEFFFNTDYLKAGGLDPEGNIDFKQRGAIPHVDAGTVLAEKTPMVEARQGENICGELLATVPGRNMPLKYGKGAKLSEDGMKILAAVTGFPKYSLAGQVLVHREYTTSGDVGFATGHLDYEGNINVKGSIQSGFRVRGNNIATIDLDGGIVEADGDLKVAGGIVEGKIYARGDVHAKFVHQSDILCMGNVLVTREIVDSNIVCSGSCIIEAGKLISSRVSAKMGFMANGVGTQTTSACRIKVGHDEFTEREVKAIAMRIEKINDQIRNLREKKETVEDREKGLQIKITQLAHVQDRSQLELKRTSEKINSLRGKPGLGNTVEELRLTAGKLRGNARAAEKQLDRCFEKSDAIEHQIDTLEKDILDLEQQIEEVNVEKKNLMKWAMENPGNPVVRVDSVLRSGTHVQGIHSDIMVKEMICHSRINEIKKSNQGRGNLYQMIITPL